MGNDTRTLSEAIIEGLSSRLAQLSDLPLPAQLRQGPTSEESKQGYLSALLRHDPGVFLERHGGSLTAPERQQFECLRADFEVDFHLKVLEDAAAAQAGAGTGTAGGQAAAAGATAKNRRLAAMNRLLVEGSYFSEKEMRERQPGMYHQYVGQYRPPEQPQGGEEGCQAGSVLADSIMRQQEELGMRERQEAEQRQWDRVAAQQAESEEEEEEEEEEEGREQQQQQQQQRGAQAQAAPARPQQQGAAAAAGAGAAGGPSQGAAAAAAAEEKEGEEDAGAAAAGAISYIRIPPEEAAEYSEALLDAMRQRFLAGQDAGVDYAAIDADAELDDDWADQQRRDAEDRYFDEDD